MFEIYKRPDHTEIIKSIMMDWTGLGLPDIDLTKLNCKIISPRKQGFNSLMTFMMYYNKEPLIVIKTPKFSESKIAIDSLQNEAQTLKTLANAATLKDNVPHLYNYSPIAGLPTMITAAAKGKMFNQVIDEEEHPSGLDAFLTRGAQLCSSFAKVNSGSSFVIDDHFIENSVKKPLMLVGEYFPQYVDMIEHSVEQVLSAAPADTISVKRCLLHNDFNPWNIILSGDNKMTVIDWEDASFEGLPLLDLYNYYTIAHRIMFKGENSYSSSRTREQKKLRTEVVLRNFNTNIEEYCAINGIPKRASDILFLAYAAKASEFFLVEKRRSITYAESWVSMLLDAAAPRCFENFVKKLAGV
ncbi:MAG: aminoglycoside phosphotransferase family protein [Candidatus Margulisiibacteriota bacterium]